MGLALFNTKVNLGKVTKHQCSRGNTTTPGGLATNRLSIKHNPLKGSDYLFWTCSNQFRLT